MENYKEEDLQEKTSQFLRESDVVFIPSKGEHHSDHRATYEIGHKAINILEKKPIEIHYSIWRFPFCEYNPGRLDKILKVNLTDKEFKKSFMH